MDPIASRPALTLSPPDLEAPRRSAPLRAWTFDTETLGPETRRTGWSETLEKLRLPLGKLADAEPFFGRVSTLGSPLGMDFALISGSAQEISGRNPNQPAAVWIIALLEGRASFWDGETTTALGEGDVIYGPTGIEAALTLHTPFRLLFVNAPRVSLDHRLLTPRALKVGRFAGARGLGRLFSGLMRATAESLPDLSSEQLRPVELAITEFLVANLAEEDSPAARGGAEAARAAHLHRVCQIIETRLSDFSLSLEQIAHEDRISTRALQKLFASAGESFSNYVRDRRLERCRLDLCSPMCASISISEICFRWGFNGSAHFSRAFKERYGVSPREYRKRHLGVDLGAETDGEGAAG